MTSAIFAQLFKSSWAIGHYMVSYIGIAQSSHSETEKEIERGNLIRHNMCHGHVQIVDNVDGIFSLIVVLIHSLFLAYLLGQLYLCLAQCVSFDRLSEECE